MSAPELDAEPLAGGPASITGRSLILYALPMVGISFSLVLTMAYIVKYSIDVLLVPAAAMGLIFGGSRIWDAITDPLIGYMSDGTRHRLGRRRPWLLASALPIALIGLGLWYPPPALQGGLLTAWVAVAILAFMTAQTAFLVPHYALGAELTENHHDRTRVFGVRQAGSTLGMMLALILGTGLLSRSAEPRETALGLFAAAGAICLVTVGISVLGLRERMDYQGRLKRNPYEAFRDVWRNEHGRQLMILYFIEHVGAGANAVLSPFLVQYVIGRPEMLGYVFAFYTTSILVSIPLWLWLSRSLGKKRAWLIGMGVAIVGYGLLLAVGEGDLGLMYVVVVFTGSASSCGNVVGPSIQADVIDFDEYQTGERKEGSYYSTFTFLMKTSSGVMAMLAGAGLAWVGYVPNAEQTEATKDMVRLLMGLVPMICFGIGAAIFVRFRLTDEEHARIQRELAARKTAP